MKTPICEFVEQYAREGNVRLHMPGHKGIPFLGVEDRDIAEVEGADVLYHAEGIIAESQNNAAALFESGRTLYSTEGSSLCIRAMIYLLSLQAKKEGKKPLILAARNAHKTFMSAIALVGADVEWLYPDEEDNLISCPISAEKLENRLAELGRMPTALYLTCPDYLGFVSAIRALSEVCRKHGILLAVDNAHGAYLKFLPESRHPVDLGADICCDSAHKTLPVLTGGAYLHISKNAPRLFFDMAEQAMALFASTSPSYLILQSLDRANRSLFEGYAEKLAVAAEQVRELKKQLIENGFALLGDEEMKLCIKAKEYGYFGYEMAEHLAKDGLVCEFCDRDFVVMMLTPELGGEALERVFRSLLSLPKKERICEVAPRVGRPSVAMSVREAVMSPSCEIPADMACGRVLATANVSCPPAIPILVCGERIDEKAIECLRYYGIEKCRVVDGGDYEEGI